LSLPTFQGRLLFFCVVFQRNQGKEKMQKSNCCPHRAKD